MGRQQQDRVDVPVRLRGHPDAEMDVRGAGDGVLARANLTDDGALGDGTAACDRDRAELEQRHGVAVGGLNRQRAPTRRDRPDERDGACCGSHDRIADARTDVDPAVLAGGVLVRSERERPQDRPVGRPGPACCDRDDDQGRDRTDDRGGEHAPHRIPPS
jgi:hypothetical protein